MTLKKVFKKVLAQYNGDYVQTLRWFSTRHPFLNNEAPLMFIAVDRTDEFCKIMKEVFDRV